MTRRRRIRSDQEKRQTLYSAFVVSGALTSSEAEVLVNAIYPEKPRPPSTNPRARSGAASAKRAKRKKRR
jgi:hypothetical protein